MADPIILGPGVRVNPAAFSDVVGVAGDSGRFGVIGSNATNPAFGFLGGNDLQFTQHAGAYGESDQQGVMGLTTVPKGTGVYGGGTTAAGGDQIGVRGETVTNVGVFGHSFGAGNGVNGRSDGNGFGVKGDSPGGFAAVHGNGGKNGVWGFTVSATDSGVFAQNDGDGFGVAGVSKGGIGVLGRGGRLAGRFEGDVEVTGDIRFIKGDIAEEFPVATADLSTVEPGTVMVLNAEGALQHSERPYDKRVAGVVSGAGEYKAAIILDKQSSQETRMPIAVVGKTYCKADAQYGSIEVGDLLTTSPTPGHAMKAGDSARAFGAVIGKALRPLEQGQGLVPILIALQ